MAKQTAKHIHFVGIKGVAMTALAIHLKEKGICVTGSDVEDEFPTDELLKKAGITTTVGFHKSHIQPSVDSIIYTGAHKGRDNPQVIEAIQKKIPTFSHGIALGHAMDPYRQISVAGSHGKTTTSAMIATILSYSHKHPSYAIGCGEIRGLGNSGKFGSGSWFVAEADEYCTDPGHDITPRFYWQKPEIFVITNIDYDHPDVYKDLESVQEAFVSFIQSSTSLRFLVVNNDDTPSKKIIASSRCPIITVGRSHTSDVWYDNVQYAHGKTTFVAMEKNKKIGVFVLKVPGIHNITNALCAIVASRLAGCTTSDIQKGLSAFEGTKRRFEYIGTKHSVDFYDDYAHHPKEIQATLAAMRAWYPQKRLLVVFQPHTYSRTISLCDEFSKSFNKADIVGITDIYPSAREAPVINFSGKNLADKIIKLQSNVYYMKNEVDVTLFIQKSLQNIDAVLFMGAGNIYEWGRRIVRAIE